MSLVASIKPAYVLCGLGVASTPAIGYGGWKIYEGMDSPVGREFSGKGYRWNPPTLDMEVKPIPEADKYKIKPYKCFRNFFPGADIGSDKTATSDATFPTFGWGSTETNSGNPMGCALMQLDYDSNDSFVFKSEVVVKNDRIGMALWTTVTTTETERGDQNFDPKSWSYYLLFLAKEAREWKVLGGAFWFDSAVSTNYSTAIKDVYIAAPNDPWLDGGNPVPPTTAPFKKSYSGFWETVNGGSGGKEIFQDIKLYKTGLPGNANILGKEYKPDDGSQNLFKDESITSSAYYKNNQWHEYTSVDAPFASATLNTMYAPFKGKKGKWTKFNGNDDCSRWRQDREINEVNRKKLQNLCYIDKES